MSDRRSPNSLERRSHNADRWLQEMASSSDAGRRHHKTSSEKRYPKYQDSGYGSSTSSERRTTAGSRPASVTPSIKAHRKLAEERLCGDFEARSAGSRADRYQSYVETESSTSSRSRRVPRSAAPAGNEDRYPSHSSRSHTRNEGYRPSRKASVSTYGSMYSAHSQPHIIDVSPDSPAPERLYPTPSQYSCYSGPLSPNIIDISPDDMGQAQARRSERQRSYRQPPTSYRATYADEPVMRPSMQTHVRRRSEERVSFLPPSSQHQYADDYDYEYEDQYQYRQSSRDFDQEVGHQTRRVGSIAQGQPVYMTRSARGKPQFERCKSGTNHGAPRKESRTFRMAKYIVGGY